VYHRNNILAFTPPKVIMVVTMEIGVVTPPVALSLFVTARLTRMAATQVMRTALPWLPVLPVLPVFLERTTCTPAINLSLPNAIFSP
jgi:TRAP-type C4-dicarboxylate transport system permease large subunit